MTNKLLYNTYGLKQPYFGRIYLRSRNLYFWPSSSSNIVSCYWLWNILNDGNSLLKIRSFFSELILIFSKNLDFFLGLCEPTWVNLNPFEPNWVHIEPLLAPLSPTWAQLSLVEPILISKWHMTLHIICRLKIQKITLTSYLYSICF